ncbi:uncharacterized protein LOC120338331 [Styela clava]
MTNDSRKFTSLTPAKKKLKVGFCAKDYPIWTVQSLINRFNAPESEGAGNSKGPTRVGYLQKNKLQQHFSKRETFKNLCDPPVETLENPRLKRTVENIEICKITSVSKSGEENTSFKIGSNVDKDDKVSFAVNGSTEEVDAVLCLQAKMNESHRNDIEQESITEKITIRNPKIHSEALDMGTNTGSQCSEMLEICDRDAEKFEAEENEKSNSSSIKLELSDETRITVEKDSDKDPKKVESITTSVKLPLTSKIMLEPTDSFLEESISELRDLFEEDRIFDINKHGILSTPMPAFITCSGDVLSVRDGISVKCDQEEICSISSEFTDTLEGTGLGTMNIVAKGRNSIEKSQKLQKNVLGSKSENCLNWYSTRHDIERNSGPLLRDRDFCGNGSVFNYNWNIACVDSSDLQGCSKSISCPSLVEVTPFQLKNTTTLGTYDKICQMSRLDRTHLFIKMEIETENALRDKEQEKKLLLKKIKNKKSKKKNFLRKIRKFLVPNCCRSGESNNLRRLEEKLMDIQEKLDCLHELLPLYRIFLKKLDEEIYEECDNYFITVPMVL